jgi:DNA repair protein RecO (recombination protein O)
MRSNYVTPAVVLRTWPFGESDKIISFLTKNHGKITGIAKGAKRSKKRFANSLEPFSFVNVRFQDMPNRSLVFIAGCELETNLKRLITSLEKIAFASYCVEITAGLIAEREENLAIFEHLRTGLSYLNEHQASLEFLISFELRLLKLAGYQPLLNSCRRCGCYPDVTDPIQSRSLNWHFSFRDGGILCTACAKLTKDVLPMPRETLETMRRMQEEQMQIEALPASLTVLKQIRTVILKFIQLHVDREIKSAPFLYQFSS